MASCSRKLLLVFGTRPEAIKMAPVVKCLRESDSLQTRVCVTGQHRGMLDQVLKIFDIRPDYDLDIMEPGQDLFSITQAIMNKLPRVIDDFDPDDIVVHGDTTTTFATSLTAFYRRKSVAHVEAGLRTGNLFSPWPEEANRKLTAVLTRDHFAPTELARRNLLSESLPGSSIHVTGNTVIDALYDVVKRIEDDSALKQRLDESFEYLEGSRKIVLITGHRRENLGDGISNICKAVLELSTSFPDFKFVYPVHPNPGVLKPVKKNLSGLGNVHLIAPLDYVPFVYLMNRSYLILTDSGGIQEEAPSLGKPVLVMRDTTERPEAVDAGTVRLVGTDDQMIVSTTSQLIEDASSYNSMSLASNPYGDGLASSRIRAVLESYSCQERFQ
jgi:UDP-N-acetylglucosamine 2-epimerase (non-hydrolysing)